MRSSSSVRLLVVGLALGLVLSACGGQQQSGQPSGGQSAQPSSNLTGGTVRIGIGGSAKDLNPGNGELTEDYILYELVFDTPIALDADGSYIPELATDWAVSDDGLTWTLTLRDDVVFHDGTPMTSEDVKFTLELYRDTPDFIYLPAYCDVCTDIEAPDATHVAITLSDPVGNFESRMIFMYILPKHIWETVDDPVAYENPEMIGTGPFKLAEFKRDEFTRLDANTDYWGEAPKVDEVIFQTIENPDARVTALTEGDVDMITEFPPTAVPTLQNTENVEVMLADPVSGSLRDYIINMIDPDQCPPDDGVCSGHPALRDVEVRRALAMAVDKQQIIDVARLGAAAPGLTMVPTGLGDFFASEVQDYAFDPDGANALLDQAGYADTDNDGIRECPSGADCGPTDDLTFRFNYADDIDSAPREAELLEAMWGEIGVKIEIQGLDPSALSSVCCPTFDFDIILWGWGSDPDPAFLLSVLLCEEQTTGTSETGYCNSAYDDLYQQQGVETDHAARVQIIHEMQQILIDDVPYIIPYYDKTVEAFRTDSFTGWPVDRGSLGLEDPGSLSVIRPTE